MGHASTFKTPWGWIEVTATERGVSSIDLFPPHRRAVSDLQEAGEAARALLGEAQAQLLAYIAGTRREFSLPVDMSAGTPFQRKVWKAIIRIPYGRARSYKWVADRTKASAVTQSSKFSDNFRNNGESCSESQLPYSATKPYERLPAFM